MTPPDVNELIIDDLRSGVAGASADPQAMARLLGAGYRACSSIADHLSLQPSARSPRNDTTDLGVVERTTIVKVLQESFGNKTKAARRLGLSRTQLHLRVRKYGLAQPSAA
jgi:transcriptional regulator with GAF, ATPase, and Fis domain